MKKAFGEAASKSLKRRIAQLKSATYIEDLTGGTGKWHSLTGRGEHVFAGVVTANWRIVVSFTTPKSGSTEALVESIEDYH